MIIARSSCSELSVERSNPSHRSLGERICKPQRKRIRFGLVTLKSVANLPEMVKPVTFVQATSICRQGAVRGGWEQRAEKDRHRNLGDPSRWASPNVVTECIRLPRPIRKSDAFIVAVKRVTTAERRDAAVVQQPSNQGVPLGLFGLLRTIWLLEAMAARRESSPLPPELQESRMREIFMSGSKRGAVSPPLLYRFCVKFPNRETYKCQNDQRSNW